jgi:hypothetical protein
MPPKVNKNNCIVIRVHMQYKWMLSFRKKNDGNVHFSLTKKTKKDKLWNLMVAMPRRQAKVPDTTSH